MYRYVLLIFKIFRRSVQGATPSARLCSVVMLLMLAFVGCQSKSKQKSSEQASSGPPPPAVITAEATERQITEYREFTGRTAAVESVEIRARVSGYLLASPRVKRSEKDLTETGSLETPPKSPANDVADSQMMATEGESVEKDDVLFVIDPEPYQLALDQSQGSLNAAEASLTQAKQNLARSDELRAKGATSESEYDQANAAVDELKGQIENLQATRDRNQLDVRYTTVKSPINGMLGRTLVTQGNLVIADATLLTTVVSQNPIYVDFNVDEGSLLDYRNRLAKGDVPSGRGGEIPISMGLANEEDYPHEGKIDFVDNRTDPNTGNTRIRGVFSNSGKSNLLTPGLFARVRTPFTKAEMALLIPSTAIAMDQQGRYVWVVGDDDVAKRQSVSIGQVVGDQTVITGKSLNVGDRVVVSGLQRVRDGKPVTVARKESVKDNDSSTGDAHAAAPVNGDAAGDDESGDAP